MTEYFLVVNKIAAGGRVAKIWEDDLKPLLNQEGLEYDFECTTHPQHAIEIARTRANEDYRVICSVGGDGTANEVINGVMKADKPVVYMGFTVGTGNDIPSCFGIPEGDMNALVECLRNGKDKTFDVGYCEKADRYFGGTASMGFDAEVADRTNKGSKKRSGTRNYQIALVQSIVKYKSHHLIITADDSSPSEEECILLAIGNGKRYGGGMHICPNAEILDGKFTVTLIDRINRFNLLRLFPRVYSGKHVEHKKVRTFEGTRIHVESKGKSIYQVDGEILGYLPETFVTLPKALTVRVPDPWVSYSEIWQAKLNKKSKK
jgi:YegS/Rv2252/BmrU family lipid kinase